MKKLSRMTALLLALMMLVTSVPITALAEITLDTSTWQNWVSSIKDAFQQAQTTTEAFSTTVDVPVTAQRIAQDYQTTAEYTTADTAITLLKGTTALLTSADAGQWQIAIDEEHWANIAGETGKTITLHEGLLMGGSATIRCGNNGAAVTVRLADGNVLEDSAETITVEVSGERQVRTGKTYTASDLGINTLDGVAKTYNIVINYVFEKTEQGIASDPYTATLAEGSSFDLKVTFPTVQGYLPYVNDVEKHSIEKHYSNISEDVTINVVYKPTNVNYTVIHYQQNVDNDNYTFESTETKQGLTGSQVPEVAKTYDGFYSLLYERPAIAADGSTEIVVYYDRYYYLMNFDMDGGYGTEPVYARYGANIGTVTNPTRAGYTFEGWAETKGGTTTVELPKNMPAGNKTYYAIWTAGTADYTIVYWLQNANPNADGSYDYSYLGSASGSATPGTTVSGSNSAASDLFPDGKTYYSYNEGKTDEDVTVNGDGTAVINVYYDRNDYTLKFYYMRSYTTTSNSDRPPQQTTTTIYQIPTSTNGSSAQNGTVSSATWTTVNSAVTLKSGYTYNTETKEEKISNQNKNVTYYYLPLTAKYGADLSSTWPNAPFENNNGFKFVSWGTQYGSGYNTNNTNKNIKGIYSILDKNLIVTNSTTHTLVSYWATDPTMYSYEIYYSLLEGETAERTYNNVGYKKKTTYTVGSTDGPSGQSALTFEGVTFVAMDYDANATATDGTVIRFYYKRNEHTITFDDGHGGTSTVSTVYGQSLSGYADWTCDVPSALDPTGYAFGGWYTDPTCQSEANFNITMPDENLVFYAGWDAKVHTVKFYLTENSTEVYWPTDTTDPLANLFPHGFSIDHGVVESMLSADAMEGKNGDYIFVMWYYYENGVKKPFDPSTPITKNLVLYGEWNANTMKAYTVQYVLQSDYSVKVADDLTGSGLAGTTKTFDAKGGTELKADYQEGYFPTVQSQSLLLDIDSDSLGVTFEYVQKDAVPYTVKYVNKETGESLADDKVVRDNRKAVVTETFKAISGYMPDAYQKRLVVTAEGENILYFYYSKDETHAYYKITHYTQNTEGETWTEYATSQAIGDIGTRYTASSMDIPGFTYKEIKYVVNGTEVTDVTDEGAALTADGLEINLYYVRNEYPYQVRYLEQGSGKELHVPYDGKAMYGKTVSGYEHEETIDGYERVSVTPESGEISIKIDAEDTNGNPALNIITFYYKEKEVTINYVAVGPAGATGFGNVTPTTETVKVLSGTAQGSTPTAGDGFKFGGWYKDAACTQPVEGEGWLVGDKIVPQKTKTIGEGENAEQLYEVATYYAKFEYNLTTLTIKKAGCDTTLDAGQSFLFKVTGKGLPDDGLLIAINGNGSEIISGLTVGEAYTVTEVEAWSWRYSASEKEITLSSDVTKNMVTIDNKRDNVYWLDGDCYAENVFGTVSGN